MKVVAFRHAAYDTPWWANANSTASRFHWANDVPTQYLCVHPLGPAAEMLRHQLGPGGVADADTVRLNLWAVVIEIDEFVLVDFDQCAGFGITPDELVADDYAATQGLADTLRSGGAPGLIFHSAALPGTRNLVVFGSRVLHPFAWAPTVAEEAPTGHLSDAARSPEEVVPLVRWFGADHPALDEWKATGSYAPLDDPAATRW